MITTSPNRIKQGGYWCSDADEQTQQLIDTVGGTWDTEFPVTDALEHLGLSTALLALGSPRPRFRSEANRVLKEYSKTIMHHLELRLSLFGETKLVRERRAFDTPSRGTTRKLLTNDWAQRKYNSTDNVHSMLCDAVLILLSAYPLHIKTIYAGKALLGAALMSDRNTKLLDSLKDTLRKLLNG